METRAIEMIMPAPVGTRTSSRRRDCLVAVLGLGALSLSMSACGSPITYFAAGTVAVCVPGAWDNDNPEPDEVCIFNSIYGGLTQKVVQEACTQEHNMYFGTDLSVDEFLAELNVNADPNKPPIIPFLQANSECLTADVGQLEAHPFPVTMINYAAIGGDDDPDGEYLGPGTLISCTYHVSYSENDGGTGLTYAHERYCMDPDEYNIDEYCMLTDCDEQDGSYPKEPDLFWWDWNVLPGDIDKVLGCTTAGQTHYTIGTEACVPYPPTPVALSGDLDIHFSGANGELVDVGLLGQIIADDSECVAGAPCRPKLKMHFVSPQTSFLLFNKKLVTTTAVSANGVEVTQTESGVVESTAGGPLHMSNVNLQIEATKLSIGGEGLLSPPPYNTQFDSVLVAMNPTTCELKLTSTATVAGGSLTMVATATDPVVCQWAQ